MIGNSLNTYPSYPYFSWWNDLELKRPNMGISTKNTPRITSVAPVNGQHDIGFLANRLGRTSRGILRGKHWYEWSNMVCWQIHHLWMIIPLKPPFSSGTSMAMTWFSDVWGGVLEHSAMVLGDATVETRPCKGVINPHRGRVLPAKWKLKVDWFRANYLLMTLLLLTK